MWESIVFLNRDGTVDHSRFTEVLPIDDSDEHGMGDECPCGPRVEYKDPDTQERYLQPLIIHNSFDGREAFEKSL